MFAFIGPFLRTAGTVENGFRGRRLFNEDVDTDYPTLSGATDVVEEMGFHGIKATRNHGGDSGFQPWHVSGPNYQPIMRSRTTTRGLFMLKWALIFFVISIIAGFFGFSGVSAATAGIAKVLFFIAIVIFVIFLAIAIFAGQAIL